jgi:hypothetical protein
MRYLTASGQLVLAACALEPGGGHRLRTAAGVPERVCPGGFPP